MSGLDLSGLVLPSVVEERGRSGDDRRAEYVLQPLERGFGHTVGNSIRRVLLSSLPGAAIWAVRADGVQHEHQTIAGVVEDIHQIIERLKGVVLMLDPEIEEVKLELALRKAGLIRASQITPHAGVKIVNPEQPLFTLQDDLPENRPLNLDFWVNRGRGFVAAEQHERPEDAPVDMIRIDSLYNPVVRTLQIETDGSLDPADAVAYAAEVGQAHLGYLTQFRKTGTAIGMIPPIAAGRRPVSSELQDLLDRSLEEFEAVSQRSRNNLEKSDIRTLGDVAMRTRDDMLNVPSFGEKSLEELAELLALNGLSFGMRFDRDDEGLLYILEDEPELVEVGE